jgi:hypothetical protein
LEIKSLVVHFQGKTVNPEWKNYWKLAYIAACRHNKTHAPGKSQTVWGRGQLRRELKLGRVNHNELKKQVKPTFVPKTPITGRPSCHKETKGGGVN